MRKNNGFVLMETIIVVSILSLSLLLLYSSYESMVNKCHEQNTYDTTETIYKTYLIKKYIDKNIPNYFNSSECISVGIENNSKICDINTNSPLIDLKNVFGAEKVYYFEANDLNNKDNNFLKEFDATTIDYLNSLGTQINNIMVVKYKRDNVIYHSYIEY